jgi:hypothetical protein
MLDPVLMPHGSCTDNCRQTADNSCCLSTPTQRAYLSDDLVKVTQSAIGGRETQSRGGELRNGWGSIANCGGGICNGGGNLQIQNIHIE